MEGGTGVEMMVMDSLDPTLLQMKTEVIDAAVGGSSAAVGVVGGVPGSAHQATVTTVDQTQIITLQVLFSISYLYLYFFFYLTFIHLWCQQSQ